MKTKDLIGPALDWAVAKALGLGYRYDEKYGPMCFRPSTTKDVVAWDSAPLLYSTDWVHGGPIIEREGILLRPLRRPGHSLDGQWLAMYDGSNTGTIVQWVKRVDWPRHYLTGRTPLSAAMRCFVASKLGDEVDIPKELT